MTNQPSIERWLDDRRAVQTRALEDAFESMDPRTAESLIGVMNMWKQEDAGWFNLAAGQDDGLSLADLKQWSGQLRESLVGNPHIERGANLRSDYINEGGIRFGKISNRIRAITESTIQMRRYFGPIARQERYRSCYTDGCVFYLGATQRDGSKQIEAAVPLVEIEAAYRNPENRAEVWAYLRQWNDYSRGVENPVTRREWIFTDVFEEKRKQKTINYGGKPVKVATNKVIFDAFVNTQVGWTFGVPHALNALAWARMYRDFLVNGKIMSDALAQFAFQLTTKTKKGTENASMKFAARSGAGQTVVSPNELSSVSTAGKGYDFDSGRALASAVATAIGVSVIHLTADPGTAGSSYGSAQTLDLPTRLSVEAERRWNVELDLRVLRWMGAKNPTAEFNPLISATDLYREMQAFKVAWDMGLFEGTPMQERIADILGIVEPGAIPDGVLQPNNKETIELSKSQSAAPGASDDSGTQAGGTGQGKKTGAGSGPKDRGARDDDNASQAAGK